MSFSLLGEAAVAQEHPKFGLLRERDLSPFGFLRLDMRPAHAVWVPPGSWGVEVLPGLARRAPSHRRVGVVVRDYREHQEQQRPDFGFQIGWAYSPAFMR